MYKFDYKSYLEDPKSHKQFVPLWSVTLHSNTKATVIVVLHVPQTMKHDSIISTSCTLLNTKHSRYKLSIIDSVCRKEHEFDSRNFWKENCTGNTLWPQILSQRLTRKKDSQMSKLHIYPYNTTKIWIFRFEFEFECGIYHTLFHSFGSKFNFDINGLLTGHQCYNHDINYDDNHDNNSNLPIEIEFQLNIKPWSMLPKNKNENRNDQAYDYIYDDEFDYNETILNHFKTNIKLFTQGWIAFHFPHVCLSVFDQYDWMQNADWYFGQNLYATGDEIYTRYHDESKQDKLWQIKISRKNVFIGFNRVMTWYERIRTIIHHFMLDNNFDGGIDIINVLFEYISFDAIKFDFKECTNSRLDNHGTVLNLNDGDDNDMDDSDNNCIGSESNYNRMNLRKYININHMRTSSQINLPPNNKCMKSIQTKYRQCFDNYAKRLRDEQQRLKLYSGNKKKYHGGILPKISIQQKYENNDNSHDQGTIVSIFEVLCINKMSLNKIINCWVPICKKSYYHNITFMDAYENTASDGHHSTSTQSQRCQGHTDYNLDCFQLLNCNYYNIHANTLVEEDIEKLKCHSIKTYCWTKWIVDRYQFQDQVLTIKQHYDSQHIDCVGYIKQAINKLNSMDKKHKELLRKPLSQFEKKYNKSLKNYFQLTMDIDLDNSNYTEQITSDTIWYEKMNQYCYDIVTWFEYNQNENLFYQKNDIFIKRQKAKQIETKKDFQRKKCMRKYYYSNWDCHLIIMIIGVNCNPKQKKSKNNDRE